MYQISRRKAIILGAGTTAAIFTGVGARAQGAPPPAAPSWPNRRLLDLLKIDHPIIQAPMGGAVSPSMPVAVCGSGGLASHGGSITIGPISGPDGREARGIILRPGKTRPRMGPCC
jgi:hypothetical protein